MQNQRIDESVGSVGDGASMIAIAMSGEQRSNLGPTAYRSHARVRRTGPVGVVAMDLARVSWACICRW